LPTGGTARFASGLSANDFLHRSSVLRYSRAGLANLADDICLMAEKEGLTGHAASVRIRLNPSGIPAAKIGTGGANIGEVSREIESHSASGKVESK
jgi:histidinol dehydrogenase